MILKRIKAILATPSDFFANMPKIKSMFPAFKHYSTMLFFCMLLSIPGFLLGMFILSMSPAEQEISDMLSGISQAMIAVYIVLWFIGIYICAHILFFILSFLSYIWLVLLGIKAKFRDVYAMKVYAATPFFLLAWIPVIGRYVSIYPMVLEVIALKKRFTFSTTKALVAVFLPCIVIGIVVGVIAAMILIQ